MKDLRIALIGGAGFMGKAHSLAYGLAANARDLGVTLVRDTLVDVDPDSARAAADRLGWQTSSTSWQSTLARPDIDVVDICTPPHLHEEIALAAIAAGKHVFCEKPLTNDAVSARRMAAAASAAGITAQVGFNYRHTPAISYAKDLLENGRLGTPLQFRGRYLQDFSFTATPGRWRASLATGGSGMVGDIGSHILDIAEHLVGDITRVNALVRTRSNNGGAWIPDQDRLATDVADEAAVWIAEFESGAIGTFAISAYASGHKNDIGFSLDATRGSVDFGWNDREKFQVSYVDEPADHRGFRTILTNDQHPDGWWPVPGIGTGYTDIMAIEFDHFVRSIVDGTPADPDFAHGARIQEIVEAVKASARSGRWVEIAARAKADAGVHI